MKLQMMGDYILVRLIEEKTKISNGGIVLTAAVVPPCEGEVISVGKGKVNNSGILVEHNIHVGDIVIFGPASKNRPIEEDGETLYVMQAEEIFGKRKQGE